MKREDDMNLNDQLPPGVILRKRRFGADAVSPVVPLPVPGKTDLDPDREALALRHSDPQIGVTVELHELLETGHLAARAECADAGLLNKGEVSVVLYGSIENHLVSKKIKLDTQEERGCSGHADFGKVSALAKELGTELGMVICLLT